MIPDAVIKYASDPKLRAVLPTTGWRAAGFITLQAREGSPLITMEHEGASDCFPNDDPKESGMNGDRYDVIIIGSGPGGGSIGWSLARTGKKILMVERGDYLPRERQNWDTDEVFRKARYQADETWSSSSGNTFRPGLHYFVGGNSKVYGGALFRLRESDFFGVHHSDGISSEWPIKYDVLEPYYQAAEDLFEVHGARGEDPTEPPWTKPYPKPAISHEPRIQKLSDDLIRAGYHPFHHGGGWTRRHSAAFAAFAL